MKLHEKAHNGFSRNDARLRLAVFGVIAGLLAGLVVNLFRFVLETPFPLLFDGLEADNFKAIPPLARAALPVAGCLLIGMILHYSPQAWRSVGVIHVIDKVQNLKGYMPVPNALLQFFTSAIALLSGGSCAREGPAIHMGATSASMLGKIFNLPNNSTRILIACGSAAAIAASFNTPIAGVIFSMEVILMEYAMADFISVIIAAVSGAVVTRIFYGSDPIFVIDTISMNSLWELPYVVFMGLVIGILASLFISVQRYCLSFHKLDVRKRLLLVGVTTGLIGIFVPEVMGMGYDSLNQALQAQLSMQFLLILLFCKLLLTAFSLGLGLPGGIIGATLMIGGIAGALLGQTGDMLFADSLASPAFYGLLGMCAMMGAVLQAPLAALMALLELSNNPNTILPAMLIIVVANLTTSEGFKLQSIFQINLQILGIKTPKTLSRLLNRYGVTAIMNNKVGNLVLETSPEELEKILQQEPDYLVLHLANNKKLLLNAELASELVHATNKEDFVNEKLQHLKELRGISLQATLQEAMETIQAEQHNHAYIYSPLTLVGNRVSGIVAIDDIIAFYKDR